jgi:hypothetical protein
MKICQSREYSASEKNKTTIGAFFFFSSFSESYFCHKDYYYVFGGSSKEGIGKVQP